VIIGNLGKLRRAKSAGFLIEGACINRSKGLSLFGALNAFGRSGSFGRKRRSAAKWMLVLSRKPGEKILIGDKISITVVRIAPGIVRIGIDAPDGLPILREELTTGEKLPVANASPDASCS
jgi:carbon storage regulator